MSNDLSPDSAAAPASTSASPPASTVASSLDRALDQALGSGTGAGGWRLDPQKSTVEFHSRSIWGLVPVHGAFRTVEGEGQVAPDGTVTGTLTIQADSLDTGHGKRDTHLRSKDFFDVENHPTLTLKITGADRIGNARLHVTAQLQVLGNTREIEFDAEVVALGESSAQLRAEVVIARADFGMTWNQLGMLKPKTTTQVLATFDRAAA